ncbi:hypothetical protein [Bosea sp. 124]|uniref:hypothetical protein n=1 Tax=Bosea sp. 124 TaxID=2135642 RepID=UPI000D39A429|nr:hypothetical protein [Bosea sp. 124]PTM41153.1 hypothetical protein C8D03_2688 [Bosea sp. 124]
MMAIKTVGMLMAGLLLGGCQTVQQAAEARKKVVCFKAGYGEASPQHAECMRTMLPVAMSMEASRRMDDIGEGLALIAAGTQRR